MNSFSAKVLLQLSMQEEKGVTEDKMVGWHHPHNGHAFEQVPGDSEGQGNLACCSPWGPRVRHNLVTDQQQHGCSRTF